jgi:hypothetical protein
VFSTGGLKGVGDEEDTSRDEDEVVLVGSGTGGSDGLPNIGVGIALYAKFAGSGLQVSHRETPRHTRL